MTRTMMDQMAMREYFNGSSDSFSVDTVPRLVVAGSLIICPIVSNLVI